LANTYFDYFIYFIIMDDAVPVVVIDNGSGYVKVGISGDDAPRANISTIVGKYIHILISRPK